LQATTLKKFLIINPYGIGDVLFTTPLIKAIKDNFPDSFIGYWCNARVRDIVISNPRIDTVIDLSRGDLKKAYQDSVIEGVKKSLNIVWRIKKEKYEAAIDFSLDHRYGVLAMLLGIKKRVGFNYKHRGMFLTDKIDIDGYTGTHVVEHYLGLLDFFDITPKTKNLEVFASENNRIRSRIILGQSGIKENDPVVALAPGAGASWGQNAGLKHWPALRYAQVADKIVQDYGAAVIIVGDSSETPIAEVIVSAMKHKAIDLTGKFTLGELIAVMKDVRLLITNDGGPLHIAAASGVKTVSIFGPVDDVVYGPYPASGAHIVLKSSIACRPCYKNFKIDPCEHNKECINSISVDEVFEAVKKQL
jgi:lipopolysaccharide heptosyltransferase II